MFDIKNVSDWELDVEVTALGRRPKDWLIEPGTRRYALLKLPHYHPAEAAAEKLASELGKLIGIPTAETELALHCGRYGIISYKFVGKGEALVDGGDLMIARYPDYDRRRSRAHSFQRIEEVLPPQLLSALIELLVFDAVIGNSDRHQDNWSVILLPDAMHRLAPSYDHGSSLGRDVSDEELDAVLDPGFLDRYIRNARSRVSWGEGHRVRPIPHIDLLKRIEARYPTETRNAFRKVFAVNVAQVRELANLLPQPYATPQRRLLMAELVERRIHLLTETFRA